MAFTKISKFSLGFLAVILMYSIEGIKGCSGGGEKGNTRMMDRRTTPTTTKEQVQQDKTIKDTNTAHFVTTTLTEMLDNCSCRNFVDSAGFGRCETSDSTGPLCYVNEPSGCTDLVTVVEGQQYSYEACAKIAVCVDGGEAGDGTTKGTCLNDNEVCTALGECLECVDAGVAGNGKTQGTCANDNEVCTALGECLACVNGGVAGDGKARGTCANANEACRSTGECLVPCIHESDCHGVCNGGCSGCMYGYCMV